MSIRLLKEVERLSLFPKITLYMGGKLRAEFAIPSPVLEAAVEFGGRLHATGLVPVPEQFIQFLQYLMKDKETLELSENSIIQNSYSEKVDGLHSFTSAPSNQDRGDKITAEEATKELFKSVEINDIEGAMTAIQKGANVNDTVTTGYPATIAVCWVGNERLLNVLISGGADVNLSARDGLRPLHCVALFGHEAISIRLLLAGAQVDCVTLSGWTPLHCAAVMGRINVARILIRSGAAFNRRNVDGSTPLSFARRHHKVAELIRSVGGID